MSKSYESRAKKAEQGMSGTTKPGSVMAKVNARAKKAGHRGNTAMVAENKVKSRMGKKSKMSKKSAC